MRIYKFDVVSYLNEEQVKRVLKAKLVDIRRYAYIIHDKEETDTHIHLLLYTYNAHTFSSIRKWFKHESINTFCQEIKDDIKAYEYLTHANDLDKYQYSESGIRFYNYDKPENTDYDNNGYEPLELMLKGTPLRLIAKKFGKNFIYHYTSYKALYDDIMLVDITARKDS